MISNRELLSYSILAFPLAFAGMPIYIHGPDLYATTYGLSLTSIGLILLLIRMLDAFGDPVIGYLSDRYVHHRKNILIISFLFFALGIYMFFNPGNNRNLLWFGASVLIATTAFSVISINFYSIGGIWSDDINERTKISVSREAFGLVGLLFASMIPSILQLFFEKELAFYHYSLMAISIVFVIGFVFYRWIQKHDFVTNKHEKKSKNVFTSISKNKPFFFIYAISMIASSIPAVLVIFFIRDRLDAESYTGLFLLIYFLSGALSMPLWNKVAEKYGKISCWIFAMFLAVFTFFFAYFLESGDIVKYSLICIASGLALGAELAIPPSILADLIEDDKANASVNFSILTFLTKFSLALATGFILPSIEATGFRPGLENSADQLDMLAFYYAIIPCVLKLTAGILLLTIYKRSGDEYETNNQSLMCKSDNFNHRMY